MPTPSGTQSREPRREQPARLRSEDSAPREESRRDGPPRRQSAQTLEIRPRAFRPTPPATTQDFDELDLAVQEIQSTTGPERVEHEPDLRKAQRVQRRVQSRPQVEADGNNRAPAPPAAFV